MAYEYSNNEYTEMVRVLSKSHDNVARACNEFVRLFPNLPKPSTELMLQATQRLRDYGQFQPSSDGMISEEEEHEDGGEVEEGDDEEDDEGNDEEEGGEYEEDKEEEPDSKKELTEHTEVVPTVKSFPLGHISNVDESLSRFKIQDQKILHQYLYGQLCPDSYVTRNIKNFKGFQWSMNSTEYKAKLMETARMAPRQLRAMCEMLDLEINGGPGELATRLMVFLQQPGASNLEVSRTSPPKTDNRGAVTAQGRRRARSLSPPKVVYRDEYESDQDTKPNNSKEGSEDSIDSTKTSCSEASNSESESENVIGTEDREAEAKIIPDRQRLPPKDKKKAGDMLVRSAKGEKASSEESYQGEESSEEEEEGEEEPSDEEESTEESDAPAIKRAKRRPTDEDIKSCVKHILQRANLEQITMKTLCKKVYSYYPDVDLAHKKDFIKSTVKSFL